MTDCSQTFIVERSSQTFIVEWNWCVSMASLWRHGQRPAERADGRPVSGAGKARGTRPENGWGRR